MFNPNEEIQIIGVDLGDNSDMQSQYIINEEITKLNEKLELKNKYKDLQERINKAIELLEKENYHCPMSLTVEKAYIIEVEKINNVISILRGEDNERI